MKNDYLQPDFYRFNEDSLKLVAWIKKECRVATQILDLGAGCGILGIELAKHYHPEKVSFLEVQKEFEPFLRQNISRFLDHGLATTISINSFSDQTQLGPVDLIVCNPPYYLPEKGKMSPDPNRAIAKMFVKDGWPILLRCIEKKLTKNGKGYLVIKNDHQTGSILDLVKAYQKLDYCIQPAGDILFIGLSRLDIDGNHDLS